MSADAFDQKTCLCDAGKALSQLLGLLESSLPSMNRHCHPPRFVQAFFPGKSVFLNHDKSASCQTSCPTCILMFIEGSAKVSEFGHSDLRTTCEDCSTLHLDGPRPICPGSRSVWNSKVGSCWAWAWGFRAMFPSGACTDACWSLTGIQS